MDTLINPLSNPKGVKLLCELCAKPAFMLCSKCRVTHYCCVDHQNIDFIGIHEKICQLLIPLRTPIPFSSGSEDDREKLRQERNQTRKEMIILTCNAGQKLIFEEKYEYAIPAIMQSLKFSIKVFGISSIELVPSYLSLGEACIGLGRLSQAEEYLSQAQWTILKTPECKDELKSRLYRNLGMLYAKQDNEVKALESLAECVYYASCAYGTDDVRTTSGYFHMANIFHQQNKLDTALSLYSNLTSLWHNHLVNIVQEQLAEPKQLKGVGPAQFTTNPVQCISIDETQAAEAVQILTAILNVFEKRSVSITEDACGKLYFTLAMLYFVMNDGALAEEFRSKSLVYLEQLKSDSETTLDLSKFKNAITELKS